ncbi:MAG: hypothetical protein CMP09_12045 [Yangia sp.]|nr:hypothetical protein [Salipiger sp.]
MVGRGIHLFSFAILAFSASKNESDNGSEQTRCSLGGTVPLTATGLKTGQWRLSTPCGYTCSEGSIAVTGLDLAERFTSNDSGCAGPFAIRPLAERLTLLGGGL